ncbi:hypothetical protein DM828_31670 [Pseudomonas umsongensis]|nr:hypothetical protein [Pseudomonas umsongensis]
MIWTIFCDFYISNLVFPTLIETSVTVRTRAQAQISYRNFDVPYDKTPLLLGPFYFRIKAVQDLLPINTCLSNE